MPEVNLKSALSYWPDPIRDFGGALVAALAMKEKSALIVTFDRRFSVGLKKLGNRRLNGHTMMQ
ncbi:hypothetical protein [Desulfonatronum sp. SC1]|uniref:hypothetical protein n=1 Tax=Desulfonatronum sp. SC1 TaxID=2109626 RepID=UPI000D321D10|nr:hypothetical protein [Desulfonatronum sp. SC1]PTN38445.1 hypothetical protein C6366_02505 [Desulfonatronum sp. SC1]